MARSKKCLTCKYSSSLSYTTCADESIDWRNKVYCNYLIMEGERGDKGSDPKKCALYVEATPEDKRGRKMLY